MTSSTFTTAAEIEEAYVHLIQSCRRSLCLFTHDLEPRWLGSEPVVDAIKTFALSGTRVEVRITAFDISAAVSDGHRLLDLARRLSSRVKIKIPDQRHRDRIDAFGIADEHGAMRRPLASRFDGVLALDDGRRARELQADFDEVWALASSDPNLRALTL